MPKYKINDRVRVTDPNSDVYNQTGSIRWVHLNDVDVMLDSGYVWRVPKKFVEVIER